ncbi:hypothetical protein ACFSCZ_07425 [Siminovitchia sediminis]|uniref:YtxH domain-containing protein n=1 Tax=Siminovitchia sediminis TaxID=1274353 RepID=A0ABW4KK86_9BACI
MKKFWTTMLAAAGVGAAAYGLTKYRNGKYADSVKNMITSAKNMMQNTGAAANNPLMEISKELAPQGLQQQNSQRRNKHPMNPS